MPTRRSIRELTLNYLFAQDGSEVFAEEEFWQIALEIDDRQLAKVSVKSLKHQLQGWNKVGEVIDEETLRVHPILRTYERKDEAKMLVSLQKSIVEQTALLDQLRPSDVKSMASLESFFDQAEQTKTYVRDLGLKFSRLDLPGVDLSLITETFGKLTIFSERIEWIQRPEEYVEQLQIKPVLSAHRELSLKKEYSLGMAKEVLLHENELTHKLEEQLVDYSKGTLGKVERNILLLGAYEICIAGLPKPVAISEAMALTEKYSSKEAVALVNGVLDSLVGASKKVEEPEEWTPSSSEDA